MKRQPLLKREIALIAISLLLIIVLGAYIANLQRTITDNNRVHSTAMRIKDNELIEQATYIDTICGEYRKLYSSYMDLYAQDQSIGKVGYAMPGSAKGKVDECYQSQ